MAIGRSRGPRVIAVGTVERVRELPPSSKTGELWASDVTLRDEDGAQVFVRFFTPRQDDDLALVDVGAFAAFWTEASGNNRGGEDLVFSGFVTPDDLDRLNSALKAPAGK